MFVLVLVVSANTAGSDTLLNNSHKESWYFDKHYTVDSGVKENDVFDYNASLFLEPDMQFGLGVMYDTGVGVEQNDEFALLWYQMAADKGHSRAQYNLALMYDAGQGVEQNNKMALRWYQQAAEQGHAEAQYNLAVMYDQGQGVKQSDVEALKWYRKAAAQNDTDAQRIIPIVEKKMQDRILHPNAPKLFGQSLVGAQRNTMRTLLKSKGNVVLREENGFFADKYDPSQSIFGADELYVFYAQNLDKNGWLGTDFLAKVIFLFSSDIEQQQIVDVLNSIKGQYGEPDVDHMEDSTESTEMLYRWHEDGVDIAFTRKSHNLPVYLTYSVVVVERVMNAEIATAESKVSTK